MNNNETICGMYCSPATIAKLKAQMLLAPAPAELPRFIGYDIIESASMPDDFAVGINAQGEIVKVFDLREQITEESQP